MSLKENGPPCGQRAVPGGVEAVCGEHAQLPPPRQASRFGPGFDPASLATAAEVQAAMNELDSEILAVKAQLERAIANWHAEGVRGDPRWFARCKAAARAKGYVRQRLQERLGMLRKAERQADSRQGAPDGLAWAFLRAARRLLTPEEFAVLEEHARADLAAREDAA